jgi:alpha-D-xyloside xylohydrolase
MMRPMMMEFPDDANCLYLDRQYMLGDSLLVAPIFTSEGEAEFYLPEGKWISVITGESVMGGKWRTERHGYMSLPLYIRESTLDINGAELNPIMK